MSPTQRTLAALRSKGLRSDTWERWISFHGRIPGGPPGVRKDGFGFIDLVYLEKGRGIVGVQACAGASLSSRLQKITQECAEAAEDWIACGGLIEIWAWRGLKLHRGGKAVRWAPRVVEVNERSFLVLGEQTTALSPKESLSPDPDALL